ncbi:hypothetical protein BDZ89DRAFT_1261196 [Hymenopellis radicata]|nr:hypothetical protein BDZ89DRAFT_1261196 [Hymenopellis radicata]
MAGPINAISIILLYIEQKDQLDLTVVCVRFGPFRIECPPALLEPYLLTDYALGWTTAIDIEHELLIGKALELQLDAYFSLRVRQRRSNAYASRLDPASSEEPRILFVWREKRREAQQKDVVVECHRGTHGLIATTTMYSDSSSMSSISSIILRLMTGRQATGMRPDALQVGPNALPTVPAAVEHLLSSNDPPSDAEIPLLHELHALFSTHTMRLDDEIASLLSSRDSEKIHALEQLEDDRAVLQNRSRQVSGALSTIRRFPKEVLQEIFLNLIPDVGFMVLDPNQGAWAGSRVSSSWRSASRYPHLWTTFRITSGECGCIGGEGFGHRCPTFVRYKNPIAILQTALRYSGSCKLDLHVEIQFNDCAGNRSRIYSLLDVLMSHSERWACVSLVVPSELGKYLGGVRGKVPELRHLTFVGCDPKSSWEEVPRIRAFEVAPRLRKVSVENTFLCLNYPLLTSFTTKFSVYFRYHIPPLFVTQHCVDLVHLEANLVVPIDYDNHDVSTVNPPISNTSLTHLTINDPVLLASLSLPALLSLDVGEMSNFVLLPDFTFAIPALSGEPLADILKLVPCLTDLGIGFHTDSDAMARQVWRIEHVLAEFIKSLLEVVDGERHRLVPKLESIDFVSRIYWADWKFVGPDLVNMLCSRKRTMRRAWFQWSASRMARFPNLSHACIVALDEMKDEGLDIAICALDGGASVDMWYSFVSVVTQSMMFFTLHCRWKVADISTTERELLSLVDFELRFSEATLV